jgi:hypothetical protein
MCVISLCTRGALDTWSRRRSTAALGVTVMRDHSVRFKTDLFDHTSELPENANAGNRFYGRDLAEFLSSGLSAADWGASFVDEDWGWLVLGKSTDARFFEIAIYNLAEDGTPGQNGTNEWGLWLRGFEHRKWLGLFNRSHEVEFPVDVLERLRDQLTAKGIAVEPWSTPE